ncbi:MAG: phosphatase PAP2 family protein [Bacteroidetes bacterium]|nr:MAG: phosphatase PAP2 family protein [Bacteroidota bacterium]
MIEVLDKLDQQLFLFLNGIHSTSWDVIMWWISGKTSWIFLYLLILLALAIKYKWRMLVVILAVALGVVLSDQSSVHLFKEVFLRLRPCHQPEIEGLVHLVNNHCGGQYGFVSSHAANTFMLAILTSGLIKNKYFTWFIFIWASVVAYSRVYLGVHYPGDVLGGALLGVFLGWLVLWIYRTIGRKYLEHKVFFRI